jgi:multimeric flavodoxin WrbA
MIDWKEVTIDGETHFKRVVDMCEELGFEVRLEEVKPEEVEQCTQCLQEWGKRFTESMLDVK